MKLTRLAAGTTLILGTLLALALLLWMLTQAPWDRFASEGAWLTGHVWGQIALLDLYSGFFLALALIWLLEPKRVISLLITLLLPLLGNPVLALWLVWRWRLLRRVAQSGDIV